MFRSKMLVRVSSESIHKVIKCNMFTYSLRSLHYCNFYKEISCNNFIPLQSHKRTSSFRNKLCTELLCYLKEMYGMIPNVHSAVDLHFLCIKCISGGTLYYWLSAKKKMCKL